MNIFQRLLCAAFLVAGIVRGGEIKLSAAMSAAEASAVLPLHCFGKYPQLDEATVKLGLTLTPMVYGKAEKYSWVYAPGVDPVFQISSPADRQINRLVLSVWNWFGEPVVVRQLQSGRAEDIWFAVNGVGTWMLTLDAYQGAASETLISRLTRSFSISPDCSEKRALWTEQNQYDLGSCFFPQRYFQWKGWDYPDFPPEQAVDKMAALAARAGFSMLRIDSFPDGSSNVWKNIESTFQTLEKYNITPDWKIALRSDLFIGDSLNFNPSKFGVFARQFDELIKRYGSGSMIELGNEPAHHEFWDGTGEQYIHLYQTLYQKIRAEAPGTLVTHGGACFPGADSWFLKDKDPAAFKENAAVQEAFYSRMADALATQGSYWPYHFHGGLESDQFDWIGGMRSRLSAEKDALQLFQTEGGACAWRPDFEADTWVKVLQKLFYSWGSGDRGWLQYVLIGQPIELRTEGGNEGWGLLHSGTFAPRFQYGAWTALVDWFAGCRLEKSISPVTLDDPLRFVYIFDHPKGKIISCFSEEATPEKLHIHSDAEKVLRIDPMGNATEEYGATLDVQLTDYPKYILLQGADTVGVQFGSAECRN